MIPSCRFFLILLICLILVACGRDRTPAPAEETSPEAQDEVSLQIEEQKRPDQPQNVATTDEPILLPARATGLAIWEHPTLPYEGLIIAATDQALYAHTPEGNEPVSLIDNISAQGGALTYWSPGGDSDRKALEGVFVTLDTNANAFRFFTIDNVTRAFEENILSIPIDNDVQGFCLTSDHDEEAMPALILAIISEREITLAQVKPARETSGFELTIERTDATDVISCAASPTTRDLIGITRDGTITSLTQMDKNRPAITAPPASIHSIAITTFTQQTGEAGPDRQEIYVLLDSRSGMVHLYDAARGERLGILQLADFDKVEGVLRASAMAVSAGNYGGLYRFGMIALANEVGQPAVRLTPLLAAGRALEIPVQGSASPRHLTLQADTEATPLRPALDLEALTPRP